MVKNSPARQEMQVLSLGQEDPLEEGTATHSSIFAWRIPWTEDPGRLQSKTQLKRLSTAHSTYTYTCILLHICILSHISSPLFTSDDDEEKN